MFSKHCLPESYSSSSTGFDSLFSPDFTSHFNTEENLVGEGVLDRNGNLVADVFVGGDKSRQLPNRDGLPIVGDWDAYDSLQLDDSSSS